MADYLLQEDGVGKFTLEDGSGFILLEDGVVPEPPAPDTGGFLAIAPRQRLLDKRRRRGRLKWPLARIDVYAPSPILGAQLQAPRASLDLRAGTVHHRLSLIVKPARAIAAYTKERAVDRELQIRKLLIAELFHRDKD